MGRSTAMATLSTQWLTSCEAMVAIRPRKGRVAYADGRVAGGSSMVDLWYGNNH